MGPSLSWDLFIGDFLKRRDYLMGSHKSSTLIIQEMHCLEIIGIQIMSNKCAISETSRKYISVECGRSTRKLMFWEHNGLA